MITLDTVETDNPESFATSDIVAIYHLLVVATVFLCCDYTIHPDFRFVKAIFGIVFNFGILHKDGN